MNGTVAPIALLGAMDEEVDGLRKQMTVEGRVASRRWSLCHGRWAGRKLLLVRTGPGRHSAEEATEFLMTHYPVGSIVSFGFGGALTGDLQVGDLLLCSLLHRGNGDAGMGSCVSDPSMLATAERVSKGTAGKVGLGAAVTVDRLVRTREERSALRETFGAEVVDMESYWVGMRARAWGIPFLAIRAVSDTVADSLPPFDRFFDPDGRWLWSRATAHFLAHPGDLARMPAVYRNARRAASSLTRLLGALIPNL